MQVQEVMRGEVELVPGEATVSEVAAIMADLDARAILIGAEDDPQGILTDRDIIVRVVAPGLDPRSTRAGEVMSGELFYCRTEDEVAAAARVMRERQIRQLPVLDGNNQWVGLVALEDIDAGATASQAQGRASAPR